MNAPVKQPVVFAVFFFLAAAAFLWAQAVSLPLLRGPRGYVLDDPDSFMRWRLVERAVHGEGVRIRRVNEDNAPFGRTNEWTSPMTIVGVAVVRADQFCRGGTIDDALERAKMIVGPVVGLLTILALAGLGWKAQPACGLAGLLWLAAVPVIGPGERNGFGNADHQGLHELLFVCAVAGCVAWSAKPTRAGGAFVGVASALALWSGGTEMLPAWGLVAALAVVESSARENTEFWRSWWVAGFVVTVGALLFEFWPHPFHDRLEFLSVWHVGLWLVAGGLVEFLAKNKNRAQQRLAILAAFLVALLAAGALRHFDWRHMHVVQDPLMANQSAMVTESQSFGQFGVGNSLRQALWQYGALPLLLLGVPFVWRKLDQRARWSVVVTFVYLLMMLTQQRWSAFFAASLILSGGLIVAQLWPRQPARCVAVVALATIFPWWQTVWLAQQIKRAGDEVGLAGPAATSFGLEAVSDCLGQTAPNAIALAPWDQSSVLAGMGRVRVVTSGYWSNLEGRLAGNTLFSTTDSAAFWKIVNRRGIGFLLVREPPSLTMDIALAIVETRGVNPTTQQIHDTILWKLAAGTALPELNCPTLKTLQPGWRILKLPEQKS